MNMNIKYKPTNRFFFLHYGNVEAITWGKMVRSLFLNGLSCSKWVRQRLAGWADTSAGFFGETFWTRVFRRIAVLIDLAFAERLLVMCFWPALVALPGSGFFLFGLGSRDVVSVLGFGISGDMGFFGRLRCKWLQFPACDHQIPAFLCGWQRKIRKMSGHVVESPSNQCSMGITSCRLPWNSRELEVLSRWILITTRLQSVLPH